MQIDLHPIAFAHNGFTDKFGIPRQPLRNSDIETRIVFEPEFRAPDAIRGIEGFSHLWLLWGFSANKNTWSPTVRPPRLGGNKRVGVFATRSPYRPNPIGLSAVRLLRVEQTSQGHVLVVAGADILDRTPIYDIKPYLRYSDAIPEAVSGFVEQVPYPKLRIQGLKKNLHELREILEQDPRPAYQHDKERIYKLDYKGITVSFRVDGDTLYVEKCKPHDALRHSKA